MKHKLKIGWLYPDLMSTYGDRGNILVLQKRCTWRGIEVTVLPIDQETKDHGLKTIDLIFGGGAQDLEQELVMDDLKKGKGQVIRKLIGNGVPALFVCGSPQLMGKFYEPAEGRRIEGLGIFDMETRHPGPKDDRLIGNIVAEVLWENLNDTVIARRNDEAIFSKRLPRSHSGARNDNSIVGFENHGGRTTLGKDAKPFAKVLKGHGNNGLDGTEGVVYKNAIGCYFHGPLLPKNPVIADWLIKTALEMKYQEEIILEPLDDSLEVKAIEVIKKKLGVNLM